MEIGERIKQIRLEKKLTLDDIAKVVNVSRQTIQRYESGVIKNIPLDTIEGIAKVLEVSPIYLSGFSNYELDSFFYNNEFVDLMKQVHSRTEIIHLLEVCLLYKKDEIELLTEFLSKLKGDYNGNGTGVDG